MSALPQEHGEGLGGGRVVVDHQDAPVAPAVLCERLPRKARPPGRRARGQRQRRAGERRQAHHDERSLALAAAVHRYLPAMHLDHALGQREPDVQAFGVPSAALKLAERVKHLRQVLRVDADAVVFDRNHKVVPLARCRELDAAAAVGILGGIGEQVGKHLPQAHRVGLKPRLVRQVDRQLVSALLERRLHHLDRALDRVAQLYRLLLDFELFLRNAGDVEQVVEQPRDGVEMSAHHPHHVVGALVAGFQQFQPREQRRERVADLVGQYGDKVRLGLVLRT